MQCVHGRSTVLAFVVGAQLLVCNLPMVECSREHAFENHASETGTGSPTSEAKSSGGLDDIADDYSDIGSDDGLSDLEEDDTDDSDAENGSEPGETPTVELQDVKGDAVNDGQASAFDSLWTDTQSLRVTRAWSVEEVLGEKGEEELTRLIKEEQRLNDEFLGKIITGSIKADQGIVIPASVCRYITKALTFHKCDKKSEADFASVCQQPLGLDANVFQSKTVPKDFLLQMLRLVASDMSCVTKQTEGDRLFHVEAGKAAGDAPWAIPVLGPSAAGKTYGSTSTILPEVLKEQKAVFFSLDGGIFREASELYQAMLKVKEEKGFHIIEDLNKYFKPSEQSMKKALYKLVKASGVNVLWPDIAPHFPGYSRAAKLAAKLGKLRAKYNYHVYVAAVYARKAVTNCQGKLRAPGESKPYSDTAWGPSVLGIQHVLKGLRETTSLFKSKVYHATQAVISMTEMGNSDDGKSATDTCEEELSKTRDLKSPEDVKAHYSSTSESVKKSYLKLPPLFIPADVDVRAFFRDDKFQPAQGRDPDESGSLFGGLDSAAFWSASSAYSQAEFRCRCAKDKKDSPWSSCDAFLADKVRVEKCSS